MAMPDSTSETNKNVPIRLLVADNIEQDSSFLNKISQLLNGAAYEIVGSIEQGVGLIYRRDGLALRNADQPQNGDVRVDFLSTALAYRKAKGGGRNELLAKAIGIKGNSEYSVIDATAGLGSDAFVMASVGCKVCMLERSPLVSALLQDALIRLKEEQVDSWLTPLLSLVRGDAVALLNQWSSLGHPPPDAIYLDPMFPHRKKSALVKKEMQALQNLLGVDPDADNLLEPARQLAQKRVVVKRPASAPFLAESKPNLSMSSKKHRFDIYLN
jgi:16S rRNA (guanine1516-N2)-methyltransferase